MTHRTSDTAIVTLAIGERYLADWNQYFAAGWQAYAQKHRYDLVVLTEPLDRSPRAQARSPAWQKCLVLNQEFARDYQQIVWLDCDLAINPGSAPAVAAQTPVERIGGVISGSHIPADRLSLLLWRLLGTAQMEQRRLFNWRDYEDAIYRAFGLTPHAAGIIQTGVLVASPQHHASVFEEVYWSENNVENGAYEQIPLSHAILNAGQFQPIDARFNHVFFETMLVQYPLLLDPLTPNYDELARYATRFEYARNFFLHFAYDSKFIRYLKD